LTGQHAVVILCPKNRAAEADVLHPHPKESVTFHPY
jgi:hypothetical protein